MFLVQVLFSPAGCFYWAAPPVPSVWPWVPMQLKWQRGKEEGKQKVNVQALRASNPGNDTALLYLLHQPTPSPCNGSKSNLCISPHLKRKRNEVKKCGSPVRAPSWSPSWTKACWRYNSVIRALKFPSRQRSRDRKQTAIHYHFCLQVNCWLLSIQLSQKPKNLLRLGNTKRI